MVEILLTPTGTDNPHILEAGLCLDNNYGVILFCN